MLAPQNKKVIEKLEKEAFTGIVLIKEYQKKHLQKNKLTILRIYGEDKNLPYQPPIRKKFSDAFKTKKYALCQEIIYQLYLRKIASTPGVTQGIVREIQYRFLRQAQVDQLDLGMLIPILDQELSAIPRQ